MDSFNEKQINEIAYWTREFDIHGVDKFVQIRHGDAGWQLYGSVFTKHMFDGDKNIVQPGPGLEVGSGLISVFEFCHGMDVISVDPLANVYWRLIQDNDIGQILKGYGGGHVSYMQANGEELPFEDGAFSFVYCVNTIDHTPDPHKMASEMRRVLAPGGKLYFQVNWDDHLWETNHYAIWNYAMVEEALSMFKLIEANIIRDDNNTQTTFWGVYTTR